MQLYNKNEKIETKKKKKEQLANHFKETLVNVGQKSITKLCGCGRERIESFDNYISNRRILSQKDHQTTITTK